MNWRRLTLLGLLILFGGCKSTSEPTKSSLTVYAASSLTETFEELAAAFSKMHPSVGVTLNFAGSQTLRFQIEKGAPADIFASASGEYAQTMDQGLASDITPFAETNIVLIVPKDNPRRIERLSNFIGQAVLAQAPCPSVSTQRTDQKSSAEIWCSVRKHIEPGWFPVEQCTKGPREGEYGEADAAFVYA